MLVLVLCEKKKQLDELSKFTFFNYASPLISVDTIGQSSSTNG